MAWSTRQPADLAGVSLRAIRHWHEVGIMPQPERLANGYKQYGARHLVLALRIARLGALGFSLGQISEMLDSDERAANSLRALRDEVDARVTELVSVRDDLDDLLARGSPPDHSPETLTIMEALGPGPGSRGAALLLARLLPQDALPRFASALRDSPEALITFNTELLSLSADVPERSIDALAERGAELVGAFIAERGDALPYLGSTRHDRLGADALAAIVDEDLNAAQRQVMARITAAVSPG